MATNDAKPHSPIERIIQAADHDLRNPVANILGFVDLLREASGASYSAEQLEFMSRIEDNCQTLLRMFQELRETAGHL